ncbi:MAG: hypothetical protein ACOYEW_16005 [Anaerolineae bacterium]|jgi:hypothetical protein
MSRDTADLPEGIEVPEAFARDDRLRQWFITGVHDGVDDIGMPRANGFSHSHEPDAWEAYQAGYMAGLRWRREPPDTLMEEDGRD